MIVTGITLVKQFTYRDVPTEQWSNTYWLSGPTGLSTAAWDALFDQLIALERNVYSSSSSVVRALGYASSDPHTAAQHIKDYPVGTLAGSLADGTGHPYSGDQAGFIFWKTSVKNKRGKWIYLRKYLHDGFESLADRDKLSTATAAAYTLFAQQLGGGSFLGGRHIVGPNLDYGILTGQSSQWTTTRTLKRRGKRPPLAA